MATPVIQISIPFQPLLTKITQCLQFPDPHYTVLSLEQNSVSVTVKCDNDYEPEEYVYVGGASTDLEESCEKAARMAIRDLIVKFDIYIADFTAAKKQAYERCANLWRLKQEEIRRLGKGLTRIPLLEEFVCYEICHFNSVSLDMVSILMTITPRLPIHCSTIITLQHTPSSFTSWLTIEHHNVKHEPTCIFGDMAASTVASQHNLAHKAIQYLIPIYNLDIIDANYDPEDDKFAALISECARNKYVSLEKHMMEVQKALPGTLILDEEDYTTPKGATHSIPLLKSPPPPPKKQRTKKTYSTIVVHMSAGDNLSIPQYDKNTLYKHAKFA